MARAQGAADRVMARPGLVRGLVPSPDFFTAAPSARVDEGLPGRSGPCCRELPRPTDGAAPTTPKWKRALVLRDSLRHAFGPSEPTCGSGPRACRRSAEVGVSAMAQRAAVRSDRLRLRAPSPQGTPSEGTARHSCCPDERLPRLDPTVMQHLDLIGVNKRVGGRHPFGGVVLLGSGASWETLF